MILVIDRSEILETTTDYRNEHPLLMVTERCFGGIYRVYAAKVVSLLLFELRLKWSKRKHR